MNKQDLQFYAGLCAAAFTIVVILLALEASKYMGGV